MSRAGVRDGVVTPDGLRATLRRTATGVTVMTTVLDGTLHGMTANSFASVSLEPPLVLVCVDRSAGMHDLVLEARAFAVTVLAVGQTALSAWFASPRRPGGTDQFAGVGWTGAPVSGAPVLDGGTAWFDCLVTEAFPGGDHTVVLGEVVAMGAGTGTEPLVFQGGGYRGLGPAQPVPHRRPEHPNRL